MKIAHVISTPPFAWATGGCARVTYELCRELVKKGHSVSILTTNLYKPNQRYSNNNNPENLDGISVFRFGYLSDWLAWGKKTYISPGLIYHLIHNLKKYDIVHLEDLISIQAIATSIYCRKNNIPYVLTAHGSLPWLTKKQFLNSILSKLILISIVTSAARVIALNETEVFQYRMLGVSPEKIDLAPNGINLDNYKQIPKKGEFRKKYNIPNDMKIVLYLGRMHTSKGLDLLINAFYDVITENDNVLLLLVGPDDGYPLDQIINREKILWIGFVDEEEKLASLIDADVFVTPQFQGFPITFIEACVCGLPIITTNAGDHLDFIQDKVGYVVDYDKNDLKKSICTILYNKSLKKRFGEEGKRLAEMRFNWTVIAGQIEDVYLESLRKTQES